MRFEHPFFRLLFFGNIFYGLCVLALAMEASLQQKTSLNSLDFYLFLFFATLVYYNIAYSRIEENSGETNPRVLWRLKHHKALRWFQLLNVILCFVFATSIFLSVVSNLQSLQGYEVLLLILFPTSALFYYGINTKFIKTGNLRNIGWLKPFIIGFTWAGAVGIVPQLILCMSQNVPYHLSTVTALLFLKNFMFISVLSIMFDIKDYAKDYNYELKTFVVKFGLHKTIFSILIPLLLFGYLSFLMYGFLQGFSGLKIFLNTLPFLLCIFLSLELQKRKSIYFYLIIIDGLMFFKALCGSVAILYF